MVRLLATHEAYILVSCFWRQISLAITNEITIVIALAEGQDIVNNFTRFPSFLIRVSVMIRCHGEGGIRHPFVRNPFGHQLPVDLEILFIPAHAVQEIVPYLEDVIDKGVPCGFDITVAQVRQNLPVVKTEFLFG